MPASTALNYRNSRGDVVDIERVAATRLKNEFDAVLGQVRRSGAVAITRHDTPVAVLLSCEEFRALKSNSTHGLNDQCAELDLLLAHMQTPAARKGMARAFSAAPAVLGRAAVSAARSRR